MNLNKESLVVYLGKTKWQAGGRGRRRGGGGKEEEGWSEVLSGGTE